MGECGRDNAVLADMHNAVVPPRSERGSNARLTSVGVEEKAGDPRRGEEGRRELSVNSEGRRSRVVGDSFSTAPLYLTSAFTPFCPLFRVVSGDGRLTRCIIAMARGYNSVSNSHVAKNRVIHTLARGTMARNETIEGLEGCGTS